MKKLSSVTAALAFGGGVLVVGNAVAATIEITGSPYVLEYGTSINKNNVVNAPGSGLWDPTNGHSWKSGGSVLSEIDYYGVDWYFNGAESGHDNKFTSMSLTYTESNQNNNHDPGMDWGWSFRGTTTGSGDGAPIPFSVIDTDSIAGGITNGSNHTPGPNVASMIYSYVKPLYYHGILLGWKLTTTATDWFVFAFDDPGSWNDDHDDYMGIGHVWWKPKPPPVPIPATLPLMGSLLGGGYLLRKWRKSRARRAGAGLST
jgi:hypothetical protein